MPLDPAELLAEVAPDNVPLDSPPDVANYREADMQGITCAFCAKFAFTGLRQAADDSGDIPVGICHQWEANVDGVHVCDYYASGLPSFDENGNEIWEFADNEEKIFAEIHLAGTDQHEDSGYVVKEILRTGEWPTIPLGHGQVIDRPLRIVRDGVSSMRDGVIAMSEVVKNFKRGAIAKPQVPLSDDNFDHKNITRVNTGFVRDLWITDADSESKLVAKIEFTEPEVKDKVLRGTYADVSCGIPWKIRSRGKEYGSTLEHVCITNRPFIDGLGPFMMAADDDSSVAVVNYQAASDETNPSAPENEPETPGPNTPEPESDENDKPEAETPPPPEEEPPAAPMGFQDKLIAVGNFLVNHLNLSRDYEAFDIVGDKLRIRNNLSETTWMVPFVELDGEISPAALSEWVIEDQGSAEETRRPAATSGSRQLSELDKAQSLREIRLSQPSTTRGKEENMPLSREELDKLELSDDQRSAIQPLLDENASLRVSTRESEADHRVDELKGLGLEERPGFLTFYRDVFLSDDGGAAVVLMSDNGREKERLTALEILDKAVEALKGSDGKVMLSDQALISGNDNKPPIDAEGEKVPVKKRVANAREALYGAKEEGAE